MEEVEMKVVHIQTIGEGWGEGGVSGCQRDRKGGNGLSHLNGMGKVPEILTKFIPQKSWKIKLRVPCKYWKIQTQNNSFLKFAFTIQFISVQKYTHAHIKKHSYRACIYTEELPQKYRHAQPDTFTEKSSFAQYILQKFRGQKLSQLTILREDLENISRGSF